MHVESGLCSDCRRLLDGARTLAHEYLVETDASGRSYQCLICDAHLICHRSGNATYWMITPAREPLPGNPKPPAPRTDHRSHRSG
jgi:hypothetical protein